MDPRQGFLDRGLTGYGGIVYCGSSLLTSLPPSPIKPSPSPLVWRLHHCWSEATIASGLKLPLPPRFEVVIPPQSEIAMPLGQKLPCRLGLNPSQPRLEVAVTACLMRISAMVRSRSEPLPPIESHHCRQRKSPLLDLSNFLTCLFLFLNLIYGDCGYGFVMGIWLEFIWFVLSCLLSCGGCGGCWLVATSCGSGCWSLGGGHYYCLCFVY